MADTVLTDPLSRIIILHDHTWYGHIIKGHPEVRAGRRLAEGAICSPLAITYSTSDPKCRVYYGHGMAGRMIAVVANVVGGFVKTAYAATKMKGAVEWLPSTPSKGP